MANLPYGVHVASKTFMVSASGYAALLAQGSPAPPGTTLIDPDTNLLVGVVQGDGTVTGLSSAQASALATFEYKAGAANATENTTNLQARLNLGGAVSILTQGTCWINNVLTIKSNTDLFLGPGVTIKVTDNAYCGVFTNANARTAKRVITGATYVNVTINGQLLPGMRITQTGIDTAFPVGSVVAVAGTSVSEWIGVWEVCTATAGAPGFIEFAVDQPPSDGANPSAKANLEMRIFPADENIVISGAGTIDGNGVNNNTGNPYINGNPLANVTWFHNARNILIDGPIFKRGNTWTIGSSNVTNYQVRNVYGNVNTPGRTTADFIHLAGAHRSTIVENIDADAEDNVIGLTLDKPTPAGAEDFAYYDVGDNVNTVLRNIRGRTSLAIIGIYGPSDYKYKNLLIDGVTGRGSAAVQFATYPTTNMLQTTGDVCNITKINAYTSGQSVIFIGNAGFDHIIVDYVNHFPGVPEAVAFVQTTGETATFRQVTINKLTYVFAGFGKPGNMIKIEGAALGTTNIGTLNINDSETVQLAANWSFLRRANLGTIGKIVYNNVLVESLASGTGSIHKDVAGCGPTTEIIFNNSSYVGVSQTGLMYEQASNVTTGTVGFNDSRISGAAGFIDAANATPTINVFMSGVTLGSVQCARAGQFAGPTNLSVSGYNELTAPVNNPFKTLTAGKQYNINMVNATTLKASTLDLSAGTLWNLQGLSIVVDAGLVNAGTKQTFTHSSAIAGRNAANQQGPCIGNGTNFYALATGAGGINTLIV